MTHDNHEPHASSFRKSKTRNPIALDGSGWSPFYLPFTQTAKVLKKNCWGSPFAFLLPVAAESKFENYIRRQAVDL